MKRLLLPLSCLAFVACDTCTKGSSSQSYARLQFYRIGADATQLVDTFFTSVEALGAASPLLYGSSDRLTEFQLPLNPSATETQFVFTQGSAKDTITLSYACDSEVVSPDCGVSERFSNLGFVGSKTSFDSLWLLSSDLSSSNESAHIRIYTTE